MNERYEGREEERFRGWGSRDRGRGFYPGDFGSQHPRERSGEGEWGRSQYGGDYDQGWRGQSGQSGQYGQHGESGEFSDSGRYGREYGRGGGDYGRGDWGRWGEFGRFGEREGRTPYYGAMGYRDYGGGERGSTLYGERYGRYEGTRGRAGESFGGGQLSGQYGRGSFGGYGGDYGRSAYGHGEGRGRSEFGRGAYGEQGEQERGFFSRLFRRGPKGYTRSDERIKEDISERLWNADHLDSSEVTVEVREAKVMLSGTVPERWMRHEIENIADDCPGVKDVDNNIRIERQQLGGQQLGGQQQGSTQQSGTETRGTSGTTSRSRPS